MKRILALSLLAVFLLAAFAGCGGKDPVVTPETKLEKGLDLDTKTAGWCVTQAFLKAHEWRDDARLVYLEWRNIDPSGLMDESSSADLYFSTEWSAKYYKVVVDVDGATDYELGEVEKSEVFTDNQDAFIFNWTQDSPGMIKSSEGHHIKDSEDVLMFAVKPARTTPLEINSKLAVVVVYTSEQDIYFNGNTGAFLDKRVVLGGPW